MLFVKGIADVLQEDQPQDDVLVFSSVHVVAELIRRQPQLGFNANSRGRNAPSERIRKSIASEH